MVKSIRLLILLTLILPLSYTKAEEAEEETTNTESEEIVVTAGKSWCDPETIREKLYTDETDHVNYIELPGYKYPGDAVSKSPNYFITKSREMSFIREIDSVAKKLVLSSGYYSESKKNPESHSPKVPEYFDFGLKPTTVQRLVDSPWGIFYSLELEVSLDQIYNASNDDVKVSCPTNNCTGAVILVPHTGYIFYTLTVTNGISQRKLVVNAGNESQFVDGPGDQIEKCPDYVAPHKTRNNRH